MGQPVESAGGLGRTIRVGLATGVWLLLIAASIPVQAKCDTARLITMFQPGNRSYLYTPGVCDSGPPCPNTYYGSVTGYIQGDFWAIGYGDEPDTEAGIDNGLYSGHYSPNNYSWLYPSYNPYAGWLSMIAYNYPAQIDTSWAADVGINGCPDTIVGTKCTAILLTDRVNDQGYFAYLTAEANANLNYTFDQPSNAPITLAPIPAVTITSTNPIDTTSVEITVDPPFGASPGTSDGFYLDSGCNGIGFPPRWNVRAQTVARGGPPPTELDIASWPEIGTPEIFDGTDQTFTGNCTGNEDIYLAYTIQVDDGYEIAYVGDNSVKALCGDPCVDDDNDQTCAGDDCDDSPVTGPSCSTACSPFYRDLDGDGFGDPGDSVSTCQAPAGYVANNGDCDDSTETGSTCSTTCSLFYRDLDGDGFGDPGDSVSTCVAPAGYVADNSDCDDSVATGATCSTTCSPFYHDFDSDGFGDPGDSVSTCVAPANHVSDNTDCDDSNLDVHATPGEVPNLTFSTKTTLTWDPPLSLGGTSVVYDTIRSLDPKDFGAGATCAESDGPDTSTTTAAPGAGELFHYLVRAQNDCPSGDGPLGIDNSTGMPRTARACP